MNRSIFMEINNISVQRNSSFGEEEGLILLAGRVLLVFYCLIFVFGLLGITKLN